jgi:hypothetical protein
MGANIAAFSQGPTSLYFNKRKRQTRGGMYNNLILLSIIKEKICFIPKCSLNLLTKYRMSGYVFIRFKLFYRKMTSIYLILYIDIDKYNVICLISRLIVFYVHLDTRLDAILSKNLQHPRSLDEIMKCTRFSKSEIRLLYRSFKQV